MNDLVAVVGGGPAGLATAAMLKARGVPVRVLERADEVGARWRHRYDRLHLHTTRRGSALPGTPIPRIAGRWVGHTDFADYQVAYARQHGIDVELGTTVERVDREGDGWRVTTSRGTVAAAAVVVCTGYNNEPYVPDWPGLDSYSGTLVHATDYRSGAPFAGRRVVVVGTGNTGAELAVDLVEHGAAQVWWSVRTVPTILPRAVLGVASQSLGIVLRPAPPRLVDGVMSVVTRVAIGDLSRYGLGRPPRGGYTTLLSSQVPPVLDVGVAAAVKRGAVRPVATIASFDGPEVVLADGRRLAADAVVACTGYRSGLAPVLGHLGVLDDRGVPRVNGARDLPEAPGLYFVGFTNPLSGLLREIASDARAVAARVGGA